MCGPRGDESTYLRLCGDLARFIVRRSRTLRAVRWHCQCGTSDGGPSNSVPRSFVLRSRHEKNRGNNMSRGVLRFMHACVLAAAISSAWAGTDQPISLKAPSGELHGSLLVPDAGQARTVALIIAGSGPTDRNGNSPMTANDSLKLLAQALAEGGIASLRYDKRGIGESAAALASESETVFSDLVADAKAWVALLAADDRFENVVVIGHSEGATIGLLAAQQETVSAYVSIAGPAKRASEGLRDQLAGKLPADLAGKSEDILVALEGGKTVQDVPPQLMALFRPSVQPYLIDWFKVAPTEEIKKLRKPCLIAQGDTDIQVPVAAAHALHAAMPTAELVIVEGMNHVLKLVPNDQAKQLASYRDPSLPLAPKLKESIVRFIQALADRATP
jgi:pimeloyl-ACP methyl ester carboxylesterase